MVRSGDPGALVAEPQRSPEPELDLLFRAFTLCLQHMFTCDICPEKPSFYRTCSFRLPDLGILANFKLHGDSGDP